MLNYQGQKMGNITYLNHSHQNSERGDLRKLKSIISTTKKCPQNSASQITIKNLYVSHFTLLCFRKGKLTISNNSSETIHCEELGMLVLEKDQVVSVTLEETNEQIDFEVLEIPSKHLGDLYSLIPTERQNDKTETSENNAKKIFFTPDFPARREAFDHLQNAFTYGKAKKAINDNNKEGCDKKYCVDNDESHSYFLLFLLTAFLRIPESYETIINSAKITFKERVYNIIYASADKQWKLPEVSKQISMSASTLKRRLADEGTSFSYIYLSARMNFAASLLRTGKHKVKVVAFKCGYDSTSYFIQCFKKHFKTTPSEFTRISKQNIGNHQK